MAKHTNHGAGMRGINHKDGSTTWVEPGETVEVDTKDITHAHEDIVEGKAKHADDKADA